MKEYTKQWIQFILFWTVLIGIVMVGAGFVMNWYYSIPIEYQPNHPIISDTLQVHNVAKISIPVNAIVVANGVYRLANGSLLGCKNSTDCEIFDMEKHKRVLE